MEEADYDDIVDRAQDLYAVLKRRLPLPHAFGAKRVHACQFCRSLADMGGLVAELDEYCDLLELL